MPLIIPVLRKNKFNEYRLSPFYDEEPVLLLGFVIAGSPKSPVDVCRALRRRDLPNITRRAFSVISTYKSPDPKLSYRKCDSL